MVSCLHAWSSDLEKLSLIQDMGVLLPLLSEQVEEIVIDMVARLEEKKAMGEKLDGMEADLELAQKELHTKHLANEALEAEKKAAEASASASAAEAAKERDRIKDMESQIEAAKKETSQLREQMNRPQPHQAMDSSMFDLIRMLAMQNGGGMMGGGDPMAGMMGGFEQMNMMNGGGHCTPAIRHRGGGTIYQGRGRPRKSDYKANGQIRYR